MEKLFASSHDILTKFNDWISLKNNVSDMNILQLNFNDNDDSLKKTIVIDFINDNYIGKFVAWDDNSCFIEILDVHSEKQIIHDRFDYNSLEEIKSFYNNFITYSH